MSTPQTHQQTDPLIRELHVALNAKHDLVALYIMDLLRGRGLLAAALRATHTHPQIAFLRDVAPSAFAGTATQANPNQEPNPNC